MRKLRLGLAALLGLLTAAAAEPVREGAPTRELHVPWEDLGVLLHGGTQRALLSREEYRQLLAEAREGADEQAPVGAVVTAAEYELTVEDDRAHVRGVLRIDALRDGVHALPLAVSGIRLRRARIDDAGAPLGRNDRGGLTLFVRGAGEHAFRFDGVTAVDTTAARRLVNFRLPTPSATRLRLTAPGDVELHHGAAVIRRDFDAAADVTRFELLPQAGPTTLVLSLNSRLKRQERAVMARSVIVDEITQAYERLHATVSLDILHRAVGSFRFVVPEGFEVTDAASPRLSRWAVVRDRARRILEVHLREETTDTVVLTLAATRARPDAASWTMPHLTPLDVLGHVAVVGVLLEDALQVAELAPEGLIPIDRDALMLALPRTVLDPNAGEVRLRPMVAYYAAQEDFSLAARFIKPPAKLFVTANTRLTLSDRGFDLQGRFVVRPLEENLFAVDLLAPTAWEVTAIEDASGSPLVFEKYAAEGQRQRIHVRLPRSVAAGAAGTLRVRARMTPPLWFGDWTTTDFRFPIFAISGAARAVGAVAVGTRDDLRVRPAQLEGLAPLDENEKARYGLAGGDTALAYRYESLPFAARIAVERAPPRLTAETYSFFRIKPDVLEARHEVVFAVEEARTRVAALRLPAATPTALAIRGLNGTTVKEYTSEERGEWRHWRARLAEPAAGQVHLAVDYEMPVTVDELTTLSLLPVAADDVAYQSGFVAVEGSAELDIQLAEHPRAVDIGELTDAEYQPGRRLLGAYGFVGEPGPLVAEVSRRQSYPLPAAIVQRADLASRLSAAGRSQSSIRYRLNNKISFVELRLPAESTLWSATVDGRPAQPQQLGQHLLLALPPDRPTSTIHAVYETPATRLRLGSRATVQAPRLFIPAEDGGAAREIAAADLRWELYTPTGYRVTSSAGTVQPTVLQQTPPAAKRVVRWLYELGGGVNFKRGLIGGCIRMVEDMTSNAFMRSAEYRPPMGGGMPVQTTGGPGPQRELLEEPLASDSSESLFADMGTVDDGLADAPEMPEEEAPQPRQVSVKAPPPAKYAGKGRRAWAIEGQRSLTINVVRMGRFAKFGSLGEDPRLEVTIVHQPRLVALAWAFALAVFVYGAALTAASRRRKAALIVGTLVVSTLIPALPGLAGLAIILNGAFYGASALVLYYPVAALARRIGGGIASGARRRWIGPATAAWIAASIGFAASARAANDDEPPTPVAVPADAIVVPYGPEADAAERILVPYAEFQRLWERAHAADLPEPTPAPYGLAGADFRGTLTNGAYLVLAGGIDIEIFGDDIVEIPLPLAGAVIERATVDGEAARLRSAPLITPPVAVENAMAQQAAPNLGDDDSTVAVLLLNGPGRHRLDLVLRIPLTRTGGWRLAQATLPNIPALALTLGVPDAGTEVLLGHVQDRRAYRTEAADTVIETSLGDGGRLDLRWRPIVNQGEVDRTLTATSAAQLDIQEDRLRLVWALDLRFRRAEHESFTVDVPHGYIVEEVTGANVRGWQVEAAAAPTPPRLTVRLLQRATEEAHFVLHLSQLRPVPAGEREEISVPVVAVPDAIRHTGRVIVRRSPLLEVDVVDVQGARRSELPSGNAPDNADETPMGIRPYQAYEFPSTPFTIRFAVRASRPTLDASLQTILRVAERERTVESRIELAIADRPLHQVRVRLPAELELESVAAPGVYEWTVGEPADIRTLTVYFAAGQMGRTPLVLRGRLGETKALDELALPRLEVVGAKNQAGDIVVQADPAFDVRAAALRGIESVLPRQVHDWLQESQRSLARVALRYREPGYEGTLILEPRTADVTAYTVTNVRVTDRTIEETALLDFTIRNAGIREVRFRLPDYLADARITVPLLRQQTVEPIAGADQVLVVLELQDEVMNELRVLIQHDRLLTGGRQVVRLPEVLTGRVDRRYAAVENAGRDEVVTREADGLERLSRQQREWQLVSGLLTGGTTEAFIAPPGAERPRLVFETRQRTAVTTAGARIGLAQTVLMVDAAGAYRARQSYQVDNRTEQFLDILIPPGAALWTAEVAGEYVKPVIGSRADGRQLRIPLVKTAAGDLDYPVVLKYGGAMSELGGLRRRSFPLVRTLNINVELSQVELRLPLSHRWLHFGGTMRRSAAQAEFQAGVLSYQSKLAKRLIATVRSGTVFEKARAVSNLKQIKGEISDYREVAQGGKAADINGDVNGTLGIELANAEIILQETEKQLGEVAVAIDVAAGDNRDNLGLFCDAQGNKFAHNVVINNDGNWSDTTVVTVDARDMDAPQTFNDNWLQANGLENPNVGQAGQQLRIQTEALQQAAEVQIISGVGRSAMQVNDNAAFELNERHFHAGEYISLEKEGRLDGKRSVTGKPGRQRRGQYDVAKRYQEKLERQQTAHDETTGQDADISRGNYLLLLGGEDEGGAQVAGLGIPVTSAATGLASLGVQLPAADVSRWATHRFMTPRGEIVIDGWAISEMAIAGWQRVGIAIVVALLAALATLAWRPRTRPSHAPVPRSLSSVMMLAGLASLLAGVLPAAGVVLLVAGVILRACHRRLARA